MKYLPQLAELPKVYADSTSKRFVYVIMAISLAIIGITYAVSTFLLPVPFIVVEGPEKCPNKINNFRGFCHTIPFEKKRTWSSYISHLSQKNSFIAIGANAIRSGKFPLSCWLTSNQIRARVLPRNYTSRRTGRSAYRFR